MNRSVNLVGNQFGNLSIVKKTDVRNKHGSVMWECRCICGNITNISTGRLNSGSATSCGCSRRAFWSKHGMLNTPEYKVWQSMLNRCRSTKGVRHEYYSSRGITYDNSWSKFENFFADMGERPDGTSLDRIDVNGDYCKENCRWVSYSMQSFNRRVEKRNKSGRTGVIWHKNAEKWMASISVNGKSIYLGLFINFDDACKARDEAELKHYGVIKE